MKKDFFLSSYRVIVSFHRKLPLDVTFREDACRIRKGNVSENLAVIRHIALGLLQQEKTVKTGIKAKRFKAALSADYLTKILTVN